MDQIRYTTVKRVFGQDIVAQILRGERGAPVARLYSKRYQFLVLAFVVDRETIVLSGLTSDGERFNYSHPSDKFYGFLMTVKKVKAAARGVFASEIGWYRVGAIMRSSPGNP